eukprot:10904165-Alexandrium_andersonii.AAC.1
MPNSLRHSQAGGARDVPLDRPHGAAATAPNLEDCDSRAILEPGPGQGVRACGRQDIRKIHNEPALRGLCIGVAQASGVQAWRSSRRAEAAERAMAPRSASRNEGRFMCWAGAAREFGRRAAGYPSCAAGTEGPARPRVRSATAPRKANATRPGPGHGYAAKCWKCS